MIDRLKRRLIWLYGLTSSLLLVVILGVVLLMNIQQEFQKTKEQFQADMNSLVQSLISKDIYNCTELMNTEITQRLLVHMEQNGIDLMTANVCVSKENDEELQKRLTGKVQEEDSNFYHSLQAGMIQSSKVYELGSREEESYRGIVLRTPVNGTVLTITIIQIVTHRVLHMLQKYYYLIFCAVMGIALLFCLSFCFINKVLYPVKQGQLRQKEFIASVSHELRAPLTVIRVALNAVTDELSDEQVLEEPDSLCRQHLLNSRKYLYPAESECERMNRLINDMLLLAASERGDWTIKEDEIDMEYLLIETFEAFSMMHQKESRRVQVDLSEEKLNPVTGDSERLKQVVLILLDNAVSYTKESEAVILRTYNQEKKWLIVEVEDHGCGMSEEDKLRIFDAFYRREHSREDRKHFGLGLSIAKRLVELHHGAIEVKDSVNGGTTFVVKLPAKSE